MTCKELIEFIVDYLEGNLPLSVRAALEGHLAACPECVTYLKSYQETVNFSRALAAEPDDQTSADIPEELVQAIVAARAKQRV
jgi:anti-sigma factor RsiW